MSESIDPAAFDRLVRSRETTKALSETPVTTTTDHALVEELISAAGWAPFHKPADRLHRSHTELQSIQPWRCYLLDASACLKARKRLIDAGDTSKIPKMLAVANALIQMTWLPNPGSQANGQLFDATLENMEHIAAASAAAQNILLAATSRRIPNYWSSGGALRSTETLAWLGVPPGEILLGSIFLFPRDLSQLETAPGKLRHKRGPLSSWARWVETMD